MGKMPDTAMVLAAGLGTRMRPLTDEMPKPLIPVAGKPLMNYALDRFAAAGVSRAVVNVHYLADQVVRHVESFEKPEIVISDERDVLLETGGGLKKASDLLGGSPVFCTNTDAILLDEENGEACQKLAAMWDETRMDALLLLVPIEKTSGYDGAGDFNRHEDGTISFRDGEVAPFVFTGLQIISMDLVAEGPEGAFSTKLLWESAIKRGRLFGAIHSGDWLHVGDPQGLADAEVRLTDGGANRA